MNIYRFHKYVKLLWFFNNTFLFTLQLRLIVAEGIIHIHPVGHRASDIDPAQLQVNNIFFEYF